MRTLIAYTTTFLGFPLAAATLIWFFPRGFLIMALRNYPNLEDSITALIEGIIGSILGCFMFQWLEVAPYWPVPLLLVGVGSYWHVARRESPLIAPLIIGLATGYAVFVFCRE